MDLEKEPLTAGGTREEATARMPRMSALPTGTVTFLFTDSKGTTQLLQAHRTGRPAARRRRLALR